LQKIAKLDLRSLTVGQSKLYDEIVPNVQDTFNQIIGNIYDRNKNNHNWYFSSVASRNPHQSPLFERLCKVRIVEILLSQNEFLEVYLDDYCLYKFILKNFQNNSLKVFFVGNKKSIINIFIILLYRYAKYIKIILCKWFISSFWKINLIRDRNLFLIDTFVYSGNNGQGTINNGIYNDRYYPNLLKYTSDENESEILYIPTLLIDNKFLSTFIKLLKQKKFLTKEPFIKSFDWLILLILPLRKINLEGINSKFKRYDIIDFIRDELLFNKFSISKLISGINYKFVKRLSSRNISIQGFIEWYENQVIDRGMILGLRKYFPDVKVCAYQGFVVCPNYNFYIAPTKFEIDHLLAPHLIAVTGKCLLNEPKRNYNIKTIVAPAFRFQHLYNNRIKFPDIDKVTILMPFSICLKSSLSNLKLLTGAVKSSVCTNQAVIVVKMHPAFSTEGVKNQIKKIDCQIQISDEEINLVLQKTNILVGSATSACVEALVYNITVIIIANNSGITSNPIPGKYLNQCKIVYGADDLTEHISAWYKNKPERLVEKTEILEDCFQEVNQNSLEAFLSEVKNY